MVALEQRYCNRKPRCVMARPGESLKNNNAEIWRETHLSRASEGPKRTGSSNPFRSTDDVSANRRCARLLQLETPQARGGRPRHPQRVGNILELPLLEDYTIITSECEFSVSTTALFHSLANGSITTPKLR